MAASSPDATPPDNGIPAKGLFVTGTDTDVGKTYVSCLLLQHWLRNGERIAAYKPVASGSATLDASSDAYRLWKAAGEPKSVTDVCPQWFAAPLAPNVAAQAEGVRVDRELLTRGLANWRSDCDGILVEGVGGYFSPISDDDLVADLAVRWRYPIVLVAANRLGTLHQTLSTVHAIRTYRGGLPIAAIVLNDAVSTDDSGATNAAQIRAWCDVPIISLGHHATNIDLPINAGIGNVRPQARAAP